MSFITDTIHCVDDTVKQQTKTGSGQMKPAGVLRLLLLLLLHQGLTVLVQLVLRRNDPLVISDTLSILKRVSGKLNTIKCCHLVFTT